MRGLALEGGGAKGAYHIGVAKAYLEYGYEFDGFVGTSIGAVNAAILAQGDFEKALKLWSDMDEAHLFDTKDKRLLEIVGLRLKLNSLADIRADLKRVIAAGGMDTSRARRLISGIIDEQKLRGSSKDFGLVTISLSERRPYELFLEDIPSGELINYIMASASLPGLKPEVIGGSIFMDGAFHNNCPVNMLIEKGYDEIVVVRTLATGRFRKFDPAAADIKVITPNKKLGPAMSFTREELDRSLKRGYEDGLRSINRL